MLITLMIVGVTCVIAVLLARRWQLRLVPACLVTLAWSIACLVAYQFILSGWPPIPWTVTALDAEPWESVVYPLIALSLTWPILFDRLKQWPRVALISALLVSCLPILAALCQTERYSAMYAGNTIWALSALLAIGINWMAMERLQQSGAGRWSLWILVGQSMTAAALIMTCYGRFGEWATATGLALSVVALARLFISDREAPWLVSLALPTLALNAILVMHIREYRGNPLPVWFPTLPFLLPSMVAGVDLAWSSRLHPALRVLIAGVATTALAVASVAIILKLNGPSEW